MPHSGDLLWDDLSRIAEKHSRQVIQDITLGEEAYQDLLEAHAFTGGTDQLFADQLFGATATVDQVAKVTDAKNAMIAIHNLYQALHNTALVAKQRIDDLYRMA
jgi:hypothetical protein